MSAWTGAADVSLILAEECLYYLSAEAQAKWLEACRTSLSDSGHVAVVVHDARAHARTIQTCRQCMSAIDEQMVMSRVYLILQ
jgi:formamidopyrimidine-DNA glycosylase